MPIHAHRPTLLLLAFVAAVCAGLTGAGCSVVLDFTECSSDSDCSGLEGGPYTCVENQCVVAAECSSDADCADQAPRTMCMSGSCVEPMTDTQMPDVQDTSDTMTGDTGMDADADVALSCSTHLECQEADTSLFCGQDGECISAVTEECPRFEYPVGAENVVFVGSIIPTSPPFDELALPLQQAVELAVQDFNAAGGLPGGRKIAWVGCDSIGSSMRAQAAARHLSDTVGVPAIVGPVLSTPFIDVVTNVTASRDVFAITPTATSANITGLDPLAWRNISSDVLQANAIVDRVTDLGLSKIVVLAKNDAYGNGLLTNTTDGLTSALGAENVTTLNYEDPATLPDEAAIIDEFSNVAVDAITNSCSPSLMDCQEPAEAVLLYGTVEAIDLMKIYLGALDNANISPPGTPPRFIFSHGAVPSLPRAIAETSDALIPLVEGITPEIFDADNIFKFRTRFAARFNAEPVNAASLAYDAAFVTLFSMSSLPRDMPITGTDVASGIENLIDKDMDAVVVSFGDDNFISTARTALGNGQTVDLQGVSGDLDFDTTTHEVRMNYLGWEVANDGMGGYEPSLVRVWALEPAPSESGMWVPAP